MKTFTTLPVLAGVFLLAGASSAQVPLTLNEIYASHAGTDDQEYVELLGPPGMSLDRHLVLVVEGDGAAAGTLDRVFDLSGQSIPASGFFVLGGAAVAGVDLVVGTTNILENGTETFYLVDDPSGSLPGLLGSNVATGPGTTQIPSLATVLDLVGIVDGGIFSGDQIFDGATTLGPDGTFLPPGIYRLPNPPRDWCGGSFLDFDDVANANQPRTPGGPNVPCVPAVLDVFGLRHTSLGAAGLALDPNGHLVVSNIGSSGLDGVRIDLGEHPGSVRGAIQLPFPPSPGSGCGLTAIGSLNGAVQPVASLSAQPTPQAQVRLEPDFSPLGASTATVQLFEAGQLVFEQPGLQGGCILPFPPTCVADCGPRPWLDNLSIDLFLPAGPLPVQIPGGPTILADHLRLIPDAPMQLPDDVRAIELRGQSLPPLTVPDESLELFLNQHRALGQAQLLSSGGALRVSNLGSSGKDGVSIDLGIEHEDIGFVADLEPVDLSQNASSFVAVARGDYAGATGVGLGSAGCMNNNGMVQAFVDFTSLGSTEVRVQAYLRGQFQGSLVLPTGVIGTVMQGPLGPPRVTGCGKLPPNPPCFILTVDPPGLLAPSNGAPPLQFDCVRLLAVDPPGTITRLAGLDFFGTDIPRLVVVDEYDRTRLGGLQVFGEGNASLTRSGAGLTVSNIGSSGCDGVSIDLGEVTELVQLQVIPPMPLPPGSGCVGTAVGQLVGLPGLRPIGRLSSQILPSGQMQIEPDFGPLGSTTNSVELLLGGQVVFQQSGLSGPGCIFPQPPTCTGTCGVPPVLSPTLPPPDPRFWLEFDAPLPVTIPGGPTILADTIVLLPEQPTNDIAFLRRMELRASCPLLSPWFFQPFVELRCDRVSLFGNFHTGLGQADTSYGGNRLTVSNIGSSGCDGVSIDVGDTTLGFEALLEPVDLIIPCALMRLEAQGSFGGVPDQFLGEAGLREAAGQLEIFADFLPIGSNEVRLEVYRDCTLIESTLLQTGLLGVVQPGATGQARIGGFGKSAPYPPCFFIDFDDLVLVQAAGGGQALGDQIRILANNPTSPVDSLGEIRLLLAGSLPVTLTGERFFEPPIGTNYCGPAALNSRGLPGVIQAFGSVVAAENDLVLVAKNLPFNAAGFFIVAPFQTFVPMAGGGAGNLCVGPSIGRGVGGVIFNAGAAGVGSATANLNALPRPVGTVVVQPGDTWYFQCWTRDSVGGQVTSNFTDAVCISFE